MKEFTFRGKRYARTYLGDPIVRYGYGAVTTWITDEGTTVTDTRGYWHRIGFGYYRWSKSWLR